MADLELDLNLIKAISSDKRIDILKLLNKGRKTPTDIAKELNLSTPTTLEHLDKLIENDLVKKTDEGRKWKYYSLTNKGELLVNSNNSKRQIPVRIFITLGIGFLLLFAPLLLYNNMPYTLHEDTVQERGLLTYDIESEPMLMKEATAQTQEQVKDNTIYYIIQICGLFVAVYGATQLYRIIRN